MTEPWPNGALQSNAIDPLDNPVLQRDSARALLQLFEERNEKALRLHPMDLKQISNSPATWIDWCFSCQTPAPCHTRRALTGADEDGAL